MTDKELILKTEKTTEYYEVKIPKTDGYSVVSFIQAPNSNVGVVATTIDSALFKDEKHSEALSKSTGELITTAANVLVSTPRNEMTYSGHRFARFYNISKDTKLINKEINFVEFKLVIDKESNEVKNDR